MGVYLTNVHLTGVHLMSVHLTGVHLIDVYFMDVYILNPLSYKRWLIYRDPSYQLRSRQFDYRTTVYGVGDLEVFPQTFQACISRACVS